MTAPSAVIEADTLRAIVRGQQPLASLKMTAGVSGSNHAIIPALTIAPVALDAADLAEGIANLKDDPAALTEWASFILVMAELFEFAVDQADCCDRLISSMWEIALGAPLADSVLRLAGSMRSRLRTI
jgi:hypothetical protein